MNLRPAHLPGHLPTLEAALRDVRAQRAEARAAAAQSIGTMAAESSVPAERWEDIVSALQQLCADPLGPIRALSVSAIGDLLASNAAGDDADRSKKLLFSRLTTALSDPHAEVRQYAVQAISISGMEGAASQIEALLSDARPELRFQALLALQSETLAKDIDVSPVIDATRDDDPEVQAAALEALATYPKDVALPVWLEAVATGPEALRSIAAVQLARLGEPASIPVLIDIVDRGDSGHLLDACELLGELGDERAIPVLRRWATRWLGPVLIRAAAATSLMRLGTKDGPSLTEKYGRKAETREYVASRLAASRGTG